MNEQNKNILERMNKTFDLSETIQFLRAIKDNKYECYFKLIMTYQLSRMELLNLEWNDIDFENDTITIYRVSTQKLSKNYYNWNISKNEKFARTYPLIPSLKDLLLNEFDKQQENSIHEDYTKDYQNYVCLKDNGTRLNINTLSRNLRSVSRDNDLPEILLSGLKKSLVNYIEKHSKDFDFYGAWTRADFNLNIPKNIYKNYNLNKNRKFVKVIDDLLDKNIAHSKRISDMEMWGEIWNI